MNELKYLSDKILYIEAIGNYSAVVFEHETKLVSKKLSEVENELPAGKFSRCHSSYIVNNSKITGFDSNSCRYVLKNGQSVPMTVKKEVKEFSESSEYISL